MKYVVSIIIFLSITSISFSQSNLIPNPGFEEYYSCPQDLSDFDNVVKYWKTATTGTPNYYNACSNSPEVGVPNHYFGNKKAYRGNAFVGIMTGNSFREYITVQLLRPLKSNTNYRLSFYSSRILRGNCNSTGMDVIITKDKSIPINIYGNLEGIPSIKFSPAYKNDNWVYNQSCYRAKGGEQTLIIGDFQYPKASHDCHDGEISYYYLDEVWLIENESPALSEIEQNYCNEPFPILVDALKLTGISTDTNQIYWEWDGVKSERFKSLLSDGRYNVKAYLTDCIVKEYSVLITNNDCNTSIFIPNVFTPNQDGLNDEWQINAKGFTILNITVYSRIGQIVYASNKMEAWDGKFRNRDLAEGVYIYQIKYLNTRSRVFEYKSGDLTLIR